MTCVQRIKHMCQIIHYRLNIGRKEKKNVSKDTASVGAVSTKAVVTFVEVFSSRPNNNPSVKALKTQGSKHRQT